MTLFKSLLLCTAAGIVATAGASAADLPSKKAAPATYVKICDAYGAGFYTIPGTDTCVKVGGYVRVDYDYRPERKNTGLSGGTVPVAAVKQTIVNDTTGAVSTAAFGTAVPVGSTLVATGSPASTIWAPSTVGNSGNLLVPTSADTNTSGFYNRGVIQLDARTPTSMGVARTFLALRLETGSGVQAKSTTQPSLEGAFVQWAGFTAGQAAQPFAFMSSWAYNTHYWGGWPNGVRQLTYTAVLGGGFSATVGITDMKNYNTLSSAAKDSSNLSTAVVEGASSPGYNSIVYVGNLRLDQAWGAAQVMVAAHQGGNLDSGNPALKSAEVAGLLNTLTTPAGVSVKSGYAVGVGASFKLPMLAAGDEIQMTAVYADHLANLLADGGINTPSAAAYGSSPIGGPAVSFANGTGWVVGAQLKHFFTAQIRTQLYASYTSRTQDFVTDYYTPTAANITAGTAGTVTGSAKGKGNAQSYGAALIYSPAKDFDIGLEVNYIRAAYDIAAVQSLYNTATPALTSNWRGQGATSANAVVSKLRIQRNF